MQMKVTAKMATVVLSQTVPDTQLIASVLFSVAIFSHVVAEMVNIVVN